MKPLEKRIRLLELKTAINIDPPPMIVIVQRGKDTGAMAIISGIPGRGNGLTFSQGAHETYAEFEARAMEARAEHYQVMKVQS